MFEHVVNSVYIPADDVISHRLDEFWRAVCRFMILYGRVAKAALDTWTHSVTVVVCLCIESFSSAVFGHYLLALCLLSCLLDRFNPFGVKGRVPPPD